MQLTPEQDQAKLLLIKNWINTNHGGVFDQSAVDALNTLAGPAYQIYLDFVAMQEIMGNNWDWTRVDNLNVGKARIWDWMKEAYARGTVAGLNPSNPQCRAGINTVWVGTQADLDQRARVYSHCHRAATIGEQLFATGTGTAPVQDGSGPGTAGANANGVLLLGEVTLQNVIDSASA